MEMVDLDSSHLAQAGFDEEEGLLKVVFQNGSEYEFSGVSKYTFEGLVHADSPGRYFSENIKGAYEFTRTA